MPETTVILVRHGETVWNRDGRIQGQSDVELNELGLKQAELVAERLREVPLKAVYSSDLRRALHTAQKIAEKHHLDVIPLAGLREMHYGRWQGLTAEEVKKQFPEEFARYREDGLHTCIQGGESAMLMRDRVLATWYEILSRHPGEMVAVVSHTGPLKMILAEVLGLDPSRRRHLGLDNASLSLVRYSEAGSLLKLLNDTFHLRSLRPADAPPGSEI